MLLGMSIVKSLLWAHTMMLLCILMLLGPSFICITMPNYDTSAFLVKIVKIIIKY